MVEAYQSGLTEARAKSTGTKIRLSLIAGIARDRDAPVRLADTDAPLRNAILRGHLASDTSGNRFPECFTQSISLEGEMFARR